ncbi:MAG: fused MFS/spermidine synthase [Candidatus Melainabacteria bacterium]|nr:fused MFS/spermidine synthase [Candidatus Melainabacteria bacterium]
MSAESESKPFHREMFLLVLALFFASGFSSLIYQVVWTRHLTLIFGSTTFATATVLAVFMGGLALGSFCAGRIADKVSRPFLWYGILEGIIGLWALIVPILLTISVSSYRVIWELTHFDFFAFSLLRLALAAIILLLPTTLMGATLPLLSKYVTVSLATVGDRVGTIYAINTLGAVCGAAQSGLILLPGLGLSTTTLIAAGLNVFLCLLVLYIGTPKDAETRADPSSKSNDAEQGATTKDSNAALETSNSKKKKKRKGKHKIADDAEEPDSTGQSKDTAAASETSPIAASVAASSDDTTQPSDAARTKRAKLPNQIYVALAAIAISGAAAMIYEVCWTRALSMVIGGSTYAFTVMLSTFLSGIFLGSFISAKVVDRFRQPYLAFGVFQILVATGCLTSLVLCRYLPTWNLQLNELLPNALFSVWIRFILAEAMLLPLTLFLGALFPIVIKCTASDIEHIASSVGTVYSANTMGAIVGSILAGFVLIPQFGVEKTMVIATGVNMLVGTVMIFAQQDAKLMVKLACVFFGVIVFSSFILNPYAVGDKKDFLLAQSTRRAMRDGYDVLNPKSNWSTVMARTQLIYYKDGPCSNVAILKFAEGDKVGTYSLLTNGCVDASDGADMSQQVLLASYPMLFRPNSRRACVIGWGSGVTVAELLNFPVTTITAVELEPAVIEAAKTFNRHTHEPEKNPRVKVEINDGRNFLLATTQKFDVIISEPSNPWQVGVCNLFTSEYFECVKDRLTPDGVLSLWLQLGEISPDSIRAVMSALNGQFKYCLALASDQSNLVILASQKPLAANYQKLEEVFRDPYVTRALDKAKITTPEGVLARIFLTPSGVSYMVRGFKPNTDNLNVLEYRIGRTYESMTFGHANGVLLSENMGTPSGYVDWGDMSKEKIAATMARVAIEATKFGHLTAAYSWARSSMDTNPNNVAKRILFWLEEEDKKRTDTARARGEIESLDLAKRARTTKTDATIKPDQSGKPDNAAKLETPNTDVEQHYGTFPRPENHKNAAKSYPTPEPDLTRGN